MAQINLDACEKLTVQITRDAEHGDALHLVLRMTEASRTDTVRLWLGFGQDDAGRAAEALEKAAAQAREITASLEP